MWELRSISANNFMSFDELSFDFENKVYVIKGENRDNDAQFSNGSGKTSFIDIIAVGLLGYSLTGRSTKDCVNWSTDKNYFTVEILLENLQHQLKVEIKRKFYSNTKSAELILLVNGETPKTIPSKKGVENGVDVRDGNKYILNELLDINEEDLLNYFLISKKHYQPFLQVNTDRKLEVIGRFTNTKSVDKVISKIEAETTEIQSNITYYNTLLNHAEGYIIALNDSMNEDSEAKWQTEKERHILELENNILSLEQEIEQQEERVNEHKKSIDEITFHIINEQEKKDTEEAISKCNDFYNEYTSIYNSQVVTIQEIKKYLAGLITCPACDHKFNLTSKKKYTQDDLTLEEENLKLINEELAQNSELKNSYKLLLEEINKEISENKNKEREKLSLEKTIKSIEAQKERLTQEIEAKLLALDMQCALTFDDAKSDIRQQITYKQLEIKEHTHKVEQLRIELTYKTKWVDQFSDFKFYLGNMPLKLITSLVNQYLQLNGSDLSLQIEGFKKLKSGEIRQALTPMIYRNWMNPKDYHSFSEGEKVRLNISTDLAFQQLINSASKHGGLSLYCSDELLSACDSLGVSNAATALDHLGKTILLVTHSASDMNFKNTITVEKKNNISKIV